MDKQRAAASFLGYFPRWTMFSHDIAAKRDQQIPLQKQEEERVVSAIKLLAFIVDQPPQILEGSYEAVQADGRNSTGDRDLLIKFYIQVAKAYSAHPQDALRGIEGIDPPLGP